MFPNLGTPETNPNHPDFVTLSDGRIVPYGAGRIENAEGCSCTIEDSIDVADKDRSIPKWVWWTGGAIVTTGIIITLVPRGGKTPTVVRTPDSPTVPVKPTDPPKPVPEPGTILLIGSGVWMLRKKLRFIRSN